MSVLKNITADLMKHVPECVDRICHTRAPNTNNIAVCFRYVKLHGWFNDRASIILN